MWVGLGRYGLAGGLFALFAACGGTEERSPIVPGDTRREGSGATGNSTGKGGAQGSANGGKGNAPADAGGTGSGGSGGSGGGDTSGDSGTGGTLSSGGPDIPDDCSRDADCPGGSCIELSVGFRTCQTPPVEATECSPDPSQDDCCETSDCKSGLTCFSTRAFNYPNQPEFNVCTSDACTTDSDCLNDAVCVPKGTLGRPIAFCLSAICHSDADCTEYGAGRCVPMIDECDGAYWAFACAYTGPGTCKTNADCSSDTPPFGPGERYCDLGRCTEIISGAECE